MKVLDLFSGIGGFSLGLERAGHETIAFCEIEPFCQKILSKNWPNIPIHKDITKLDGKQYAGKVDIVCGGFHCQDLSCAGNQEGIDGKRSGLWAEMHRIISEVRPSYTIVENVPNLLSGNNGRWFGRVLGDLASIRYDAEWHCIPASNIGAPHERDRIWIVAYPQEVRDSSQSINGNCGQNKESSRQSGGGSLCDELGSPNYQRLQGLRRLLRSARERSAWQDGEIIIGRDGKGRLCKPRLPLVAYGVSNGVERIGSTGNAVVPQIPEIIGMALK